MGEGPEGLLKGWGDEPFSASRNVVGAPLQTGGNFASTKTSCFGLQLAPNCNAISTKRETKTTCFGRSEQPCCFPLLPDGVQVRCFWAFRRQSFSRRRAFCPWRKGAASEMPVRRARAYSWSCCSAEPCGIGWLFCQKSVIFRNKYYCRTFTAKNTTSDCCRECLILHPK